MFLDYHLWVFRILVLGFHLWVLLNPGRWLLPLMFFYPCLGLPPLILVGYLSLISSSGVTYWFRITTSGVCYVLVLDYHLGVCVI